MGRRTFSPEQIIAKLREMDVLVGRSATAVEACRHIGISEQTLYRGHKAYGRLTGRRSANARINESREELNWIEKRADARSLPAARAERR